MMVVYVFIVTSIVNLSLQNGKNIIIYGFINVLPWIL
jgi:FtsH-binding integral membrane protein